MFKKKKERDKVKLESISSVLEEFEAQIITPVEFSSLPIFTIA